MRINSHCCCYSYLGVLTHPFIVPCQTTFWAQSPKRPSLVTAHALFAKMSRFGFYFIFFFLLYKSPSLILALCFAIYVYIHYRTRWNCNSLLFSGNVRKVCVSSTSQWFLTRLSSFPSVRQELRCPRRFGSTRPQPAAMIDCWWLTLSNVGGLVGNNYTDTRCVQQ